MTDRPASKLWTGARHLAVAAAIALTCQPANAATDEEDELGTLSGIYLAARLADSEKDVGRAAEYYRSAYRSDPDNGFLLERAMILTGAEGNIDEAINLANELVERLPESQGARLLLAVRAMRGRTYSAAISEIEKSGDGALASLTKALLAAWADLGQDRVDDALTALDGLTGEGWYEPFKLLHSGHIALAGGRTGEASAIFKKAYERDKNAIRIVESYARTLAIAGDRQLAMDIVSDFLIRFPQNPLALATLADLRGEGPVAPAVANAVQGASEVLSGLGAAIGQESGAELAIFYLRLALYLDPDLAGGLAAYSLGNVLVASSQYEAAIPVFEQIAAGAPFGALGQLQAAMSLDRLDRDEDADTAFRSAIEQDPDSLQAHLSYGGMLRGRQRFADAVNIYTDAIALVPEPLRAHWTLFYYRGIAHERTKQWPRAEADFQRALELFPDQPLVLNYLGYSWVDMGMNLEPALEMIRKAVDLRPNDGYIVDSLGWAYYRLGRYEDAVREMERAVALRAEDPVINDHLGDAYWKVGRTLEAQFQWRHARDLGAESPDLERIAEKIKSGSLIEADPEGEQDKTELVTPPVTGHAAMTPQPGADAGPATTGSVTRTHVVQDGETLWDIAVRFFGDGYAYRKIYEANRDLLPNVDAILPGLQLRIPEDI
ncbi:MAG: tetratricopeptide repeat protein [Alphaproteobacteria bacterium]